jgi:WW domain-binding protein 2
MTFKEGGAFDFSSNYERIKETLWQAAETARESGRIADLSEVDLEQLPAYEEVADAVPVSTSQPPIHRPTPIAPIRASYPSGTSHTLPPSSRNPPPSADRIPPPNEPPPGYEETQQNTIANNLEETVRRSQ